MCGISGIYSFTQGAEHYRQYLEASTGLLSKRGPDKRASFIHKQVGLGHARLSILDVSDAGSQPMTDHTGRYTIIFNGEVYNYQDLRARYLGSQQIPFHSSSDTEVLLYLYIHVGPSMVELLDGFFAFAIYDKEEETVFIARDRIGIKPLLYYHDTEKVIFASEMKSILAFPVKKELDHISLYQYLQLNYIAAPSSIFRHVKKLMPGHTMTIRKDGSMEQLRFYKIPRPDVDRRVRVLPYEDAKKQLALLMEKGVKDRLIADVPLGAFLSGGIDSSIIVALASKHTPHLNTFSVGYKDEPYFDETKYAELVARKFNTNHTTFSLSNNDLYEHLFEMLDYIDEPFADSSAIAVNILSRHTRSKVTVALSGDGADELFAGYNKHYAEYNARKGSLANLLFKAGGPVFKSLPQSRNSKLGNLFRQLDRYSQGLSLSEKERYWRWCAFASEEEAWYTMSHQASSGVDKTGYGERKKEILKYISKEGNFNDVLYTDMHLVLQNDMLTKVDLMSMANSLEVRVPFLAHNFVNFAFSLPPEYKIHKGERKRILKDAFRDVLPSELFSRPKHGFEVPLLKWFRGELKILITDDLLSDAFIREQGIFEPAAITQLKNQLFSSSPGEVQARIWGLIVFQYWWKKYFRS